MEHDHWEHLREPHPHGPTRRPALWIAILAVTTVLFALSQAGASQSLVVLIGRAAGAFLFSGIPAIIYWLGWKPAFIGPFFVWMAIMAVLVVGSNPDLMSIIISR